MPRAAITAVCKKSFQHYQYFAIYFSFGFHVFVLDLLSHSQWSSHFGHQWPHYTWVDGPRTSSYTAPRSLDSLHSVMLTGKRFAIFDASLLKSKPLKVEKALELQNCICNPWNALEWVSRENHSDFAIILQCKVHLEACLQIEAHSHFVLLIVK